MTLADALTLARLAAVPAFVAAAVLGHATLFTVLVVGGLATDAIDGTVARHLGTASERGARLDSLADAAFYLTAPASALLVFPHLRADLAGTAAMIILGYAVPPLVGIARFRRLTCYHATLARLAGAAVGLGFVAFALWGVAWALRAGAVVLVASAIEEVLITLVLPHWTPNVPGIAHALVLARRPRVDDTVSSTSPSKRLQ